MDSEVSCGGNTYELSSLQAKTGALPCSDAAAAAASSKGNRLESVRVESLGSICELPVAGVMLATSAYMVIILLRHQRQHKHLHSLSHLRASPEKRATQTILLLVIFFVVMYWVDFIISSTAILLRMYDPVTLSVQKFVMNVYPTITPLIQISSDNRIINMLKLMQSMCHRIFKKI
ncbi:Vomeronasal type-1 receptor 90 [Microtus ochrogaster]|uniref:Vomeronasal type-1 receptor n=1 Tax=Microtus ochrogaster TaxID=79684 RepID=A0A8J6G181_MICOH|nr:Vomeronasal type-1 receptor 90 [Microtus ochrogaster]